MARVTYDDEQITVQLSSAEKVFALHGDVAVPRTAVRDVEVVDEPIRSVKGLRAPGTGVPRRVALGTWRRRGAKDFVAAYGGRPGVVIELDATQPHARLIVSTDNGTEVAAALRPR